jgi:hypothetical protein
MRPNLARISNPANCHRKISDDLSPTDLHYAAIFKPIIARGFRR